LGLLDRIQAARSPQATQVERKGWSEPAFWDYDQLRWPFLSTYSLTPDKEQIESDYEGYIEGAYKSDGIVFALILARQMVFAEARFLWRDRVKRASANTICRASPLPVA
jgi:hypothetical protein